MTVSRQTPDQPLNDLDKGASGTEEGIALAALAGSRWNVLREDLPLPVAIVKDQAVRANSAWMRAFLARTGAKIAPHGKTSMAPDLFNLQIEDGAWAITLSTPHQIRVARASGIQRIFLANQLIGEKAVHYVLRQLADDAGFDFYCLVDSLALVEQLERHCAAFAAAARLKVLVEIGFADGRTGCRNDDDAMEVARAVRASGHLALCGVEGFEGIIRGDTQELRNGRVCAFLDRIVAVAERCAGEALFETSEILLTAGGTSFFDLVVERFGKARMTPPPTVLTRSGCYLTFDSKMFQAALERMKVRSPGAFEGLGDLTPALEVWGYVQSRPEPDTVIVGLGKRDISYDDLPIPLYAFRRGEAEAPRDIAKDATSYRIDDQHCYLRVDPGSDFAVGDLVGFGVSHPCLTFDKWRLIYRIDEKYDVVGAFRTYF